MLQSLLIAVAGLAGFALIVAGLYSAWEPLGYISGGLILVVAAVTLDPDESES